MPSVVAAVVMPLVAITFSALARPWLIQRGLHPVTAAALAGLVFAAGAYRVLTDQGARAVVSKAALLGFVVAQSTLIPKAKSVSGAIAFVALVTILTINLRNIEQYSPPGVAS
jgi:hypothetical protein